MIVKTNLTPEQLKRCSELLDVIVQLNNDDFGWAVEEAQIILGYKIPSQPRVKRKLRRGLKASRYYSKSS